MKLLRETIRQLILENFTIEEKIAKLLTSTSSTAQQGAELGESIGLVEDFFLTVHGGSIHLVTLKTPKSLADEILKYAKGWQSLDQETVRMPDGSDWVESSYAIAAY